MGNKLGFGSKQPQQSQNNNNVESVQFEGIQQNAFQSYGNISNNNYNQIDLAPGGSIRLLNEKEEDKGKKVVAVIVTFCTGGSYDSLFTTVEQKSMEGTKVEVYACDSNYLAELVNAFEGKPKDDTAIKLMASVKAVDPDCVVFNWQCCGGYSGQTFQEGNDLVFKFLRKMIDRGHMCMFSDFSLKALVAQWKDKYELGPNPFVKTGEYSGDFQIKFSNAVLKECPSAQLQIVGDMAEGGMCNIHAMGGTIQYCVDKNKTKHNHYTLQALTVVTNIIPPKESYMSQAGQFLGSAGHVLLKYPTGGMILTSMGHWVELMKIDTSEKKLFEVAQKEFGATQAMRMKAQYDLMDSSMQQEYVQTKAREFVRNQAPCTNMYKKSAW